LPATGTSGFGSVSVKGRMRLPKPAASTMARSIIASSYCGGGT
jgi:hypothetical protein